MAFTPAACADCSDCAQTPVTLCDTNGPFLRLIDPCSNPPVVVGDFTLDGAPYVPSGPVSTCAGSDTPIPVPLPVTITDGTDGPADVYPRTDAVLSLSVADDCQHMQAKTLTLVPDTDTPVIFDQPGRILRILNWHLSQRLLVKTSPTTDLTDPDATRVGIAPTASVPGSRTLPFITDTIYLRSAGAAETSLELYW